MSDPAPDPEPPVPNLVRCQVTFTDNTGLPENWVVNTFHFGKAIADSFEQAAAKLVPLVGAFYENGLTSPATYPSIGSYLASYLTRAYTLKFYDMSLLSGLRLPLTWTRTLPAAAATTNLASELACAITYAGAPPITGVKRGRVYIGPFNSTAANQGSATTYARPLNAMVDAFRYHARALANACEALTPAEYSWVIYSRKAEGKTPVDTGWVDDEWDVQRRRGHDATTRATYAVTHLP